LTQDLTPTITVDAASGGHCVILKFQVYGVDVLMLYKHPKYSNVHFVHKLGTFLIKMTGKILVFGDININLQKPEGQNILELFRSRKLKSKLNINHSSTDGGSHIDICFSNVNDIEAWFYESYYSYHKPICMVWPKT
jgi:hypothetical protein